MGTGGYRYGAGRSGWRQKCEQMLSLDIRGLQRKGLLAPNQFFSWSWSRDGKPAGSVGVITSEHAVTLNYHHAPYEHEPSEVRCRIRLTRTPCHYGKSRPWFICPDCGRRCAVVYGISRYGNFACRVCQQLGYSSEAEDPIDRTWRKQQKLEAKLAEDGERPPRMHQRTYERICDRIVAAASLRDALCMTRFYHLMGSVDLEELLA
jgi:hypothetical protein